MTSTFSSDFRARRRGFSRPVLLRARYKSRLEDKLAGQLEARGHPFDYEVLKLEYTVPERRAKYTPDFDLKNGVIIEAKGWLTPEDRKKMVLVKEQHPKLDIRFVFQGDPTKKPIYPKSPTSYAKWCEDHGFPWAGKGVIPDDWLRPPTQH